MTSNVNALFSVSSAPVQRNDSTPTVILESTSDQKNKELYDLIFDYLVEKGIIDLAGNPGINFKEVVPFKNAAEHFFQEPQTKRHDHLLKKTFTIKAPNKEFEFETSLNEIFKALKIKFHQAVGGIIDEILGSEAMRQLCEDLKIPKEFLTDEFFSSFEKKAVDLDLRIPCRDPETSIQSLCAFFATKLTGFQDLSLEQKQELIRNSGFIKKFIQQPNKLKSDSYGLVTFGNGSDFSVDFLFVSQLKRDHLFKHDAPKIDVAYSDDNYNKYSIKFHAKSYTVLECLILKLTKILNAENIKEIDCAGAIMLFSYLTKGWRYHCNELENTLVSTFLISANFDLLTKSVRSHFPNDVFAPFIFCFNACNRLLDNKPEQIAHVARELLLAPDNEQNIDGSPLESFKEIMLLLKSEKESVVEGFQLFDSFLQIFGHFSCFFGNQQSDALKVFKTSIDGCPHLKFKFAAHKSLHIFVKDDLESALKKFKAAAQKISLDKKQALFNSFRPLQQLLMPPLKIDFKNSKSQVPSVHEKEVSHDLLQIAFEFIDSFDGDSKSASLLNQIGFTLICYAGILEKKSSYLPQVLINLPELLKIEKSVIIRNNLLQVLLMYWQSVNVNFGVDTDSFFTLASQETSSPEEIIKQFYLCFGSCKLPQIQDHILKTWENDPNLFDLDLKMKLIKNFSGQNPHLCLQMIKVLLNRQENIKEIKSLFDSVFEAYLQQPLLLDRDLPVLAEIAAQIINKLESYKETPDINEFKSFTKLIKELLKTHFVKAENLITSLENKNIVPKTCELFINEKARLLLQLPPLDPKAAPHMIQERVKLLLQGIFTGLNSDLANGLTNAIFKILNMFIVSKKQMSANLKDLIKPKLEWLLIQFLKNKKDPFKSLSFCFTIIDLINPAVMLQDNLTNALIPVFSEFLETSESSEKIEFLNQHLQVLSDRSPTKIGEEELQLYSDLVKLALEASNTEIATKWIKKILHCYEKNKRNLPSSILTYFDDCFNQWLTNKNLQEALSLLEFFDLKVPNQNPEKWKRLILSFNETQPLKQIALLSKKSELFKQNEEIKVTSKKIILSTLKNEKLLKDCRSQGSFSHILKLIQFYQLADAEMIECLRSSSLFLKDKAISELIFSKLQEMKLPLNKLASHFYPLFLVKSEKSIILLDACEEIFSEEVELNLHYELLTLCLNLLSFKSIQPLKIEKTFKYIEAETKKNPDFDYVTFASLDKTPFLNALSAENSQFLLQMGCMFCIFKVNSCQASMPSDLVSPYIELKPILKKVIAIASQNYNSRSYVNLLLSSKFFTPKEIAFLKGQVSQIVFQHIGQISHVVSELPDSEKHLMLIKDAFDHYLINLYSVNESLEFQQSNLNSAARALNALIFTHYEYPAYEEYHGMIFEYFLKYVDKKLYPNIILNNYGLNCLIDEPIEPVDRVIILKKLENFLLTLANTSVDEMLKKCKECKTKEELNLLNPIYFKIVLINISNLDLLIPMANKNSTLSDELLSFLLKCCSAFNIIPANDQKKEWMPTIKSLVNWMSLMGLSKNLTQDQRKRLQKVVNQAF